MAKKKKMEVPEPLQGALNTLIARIDQNVVEQDRTALNVPYRIKWRGKFITTRSGKTVWRRIGDAKAAFRHEINNDLHDVLEEAIGDYPRAQEREAFYQLIVNSGLVEFVPYVEG